VTYSDAPETTTDRNAGPPERSTLNAERGDPRPTESKGDSFGWRGWVLLSVVAFSFFLAPILILWRPPMLPRWVALVAFPMLPGILLGATAVWASLQK
jgi:hypothetical protein